MAQWCLETTVRYLKTRYQFGRPVGSFQALKHRLADLWVASPRPGRSPATPPAASPAPIRTPPIAASRWPRRTAREVAVRAAEECVQLHGGIGFTWEHPAHLYLKRAKGDAIAFGTPDRHRAAVARLVDLPLEES